MGLFFIKIIENRFWGANVHKNSIFEANIDKMIEKLINIFRMRVAFFSKIIENHFFVGGWGANFDKLCTKIQFSCIFCQSLPKNGFILKILFQNFIFIKICLTK